MPVRKFGSLSFAGGKFKKMAVTQVEISLGGRTLMHSDRQARQAQADGRGRRCQFGETVVLGTVVRANPREGIDFFPLTVDYREKLNAAGKFPGGFRKREERARTGKKP